MGIREQNSHGRPSNRNLYKNPPPDGRHIFARSMGPGRSDILSYPRLRVVVGSITVWFGQSSSP